MKRTRTEADFYVVNAIITRANLSDECTPHYFRTLDDANAYIRARKETIVSDFLETSYLQEDDDEFAAYFDEDHELKRRRVLAELDALFDRADAFGCKDDPVNVYQYHWQVKRAYFNLIRRRLEFNETLC